MEAYYCVVCFSKYLFQSEEKDMKTILSLLCLLITLPSYCALAQEQRPTPNPAPEAITTVGDHASLTCTVILTGSLAKKTDDPIGSSRLRPVIENYLVWDEGGAWAGSNDEETHKGISKAISSTLNSQDILDKLEKQNLAADEEKVATFTIYLANCQHGLFRHSDQKGVFFEKEEHQYSALVQVRYLPSFTPTTEENAIGQFFDLMRAFSSFTDRFHCPAIWITLLGDNPIPSSPFPNTAVIWGGNKPWTHIVSTPPAALLSPKE